MCDDIGFTQTQNVNECMSICQNESYESTAEDDNVWGKLFPNGKSFELVCMYFKFICMLEFLRFVLNVF